MLDYRVYTFLMLYEEMNYRRTAEKLNMTQPGVTQHIHYLERFYGVKLFAYDGHRLSRTKEAEWLKQYFDRIRTEELAVKESFSPSEGICLNVGATKTIGEYVIVPLIHHFLKSPMHSLNLDIDNTEHLLHMLEHSELDFAMIEGVFDKEKYRYQLYKKENFVGICGWDHPFANRVVRFEDILKESIVVREKGSGTRRLLEQAVCDRGFSLDSFDRCSSVSNFSVICELVAKNNMITFAYEPIASCRDDITTFQVTDMNIQGEFNFVYCNERIAGEKIKLFMQE